MKKKMAHNVSGLCARFNGANTVLAPVRIINDKT